MKRKTLPPGQYGDISGYHPKELTNKDLGQFRTGLHAGNPANMVLLVREIDQLRAELERKKNKNRAGFWSLLHRVRSLGFFRK